jgi:2-succinyl-5-enolpyruvyl-6-hydroxy-3-cyclohexene-1-carboxylate synthase
MAGPWILNQLENIKVSIIVVNNGGGKIFSGMFPQPEFQNSHHLNFRSLAELWHLTYEKWSAIPNEGVAANAQLIEMTPDGESTERFWEKFHVICRKETENMVSKGLLC